MPKLIFTSHYLRDAPPEHLENYVRYIGTREGVEKIDESKLSLPATGNQKELIAQLIRDIPQTKELLEYADFLLRPTIGNASEFISCALEQNVDLIGNRKNYVDYIANRPRVERVGEHGLFTDAGVPVVLKRVQEDVVNHKGPVWTHVISLRREDAARLGYDSASQWMALLRSKRAMLCRHMKIDSANLRWYAAFHNEGHHPHVHLMVYSAKDNDWYLTKPSIEAMRSELAHDIFRQDFANLYEEQNQARAALKSGAEDVIRQKIENLKGETLVNDEIERMMVLLSERLKNTSGKKVYGYLKRDVKNLVDQIVDELAKDSRVSELYQAWGKWQDEIRSTYQNDLPPLPPLSEQKQFKSIKNMVIAEAWKLSSHQLTFEDEYAPEPEIQWAQEEVLPDGEMEPEQVDPDETDLPEGMQKDRPKQQNVFHASWSDGYKRARGYLYGSEEVGQDFEQAFELFLAEAETGNALAMYDLGRMCADGLGREADPETAETWYRKALGAFLAVEQTAKERKLPYLWYRIGKMYAAGLGTETDYKTAAEWFAKAASQKHKYVQYSLGGLYCRGQGVEQNFEQARRLYQMSAKQGNPYASYELAKMFRDGVGTEKDSERAEKSFKDAFIGFSSLEKKSHDDKLQYRLGWMLHTGTGAEKDDALAKEYWKQAARLGNVHAQYALGKQWLENGTGNPDQALKWLMKAAEAENCAAQYALAKFYRDGHYVPQDMERAVELFSQSAERGNEYAAYQLGRLYLANEEIPKDVQLAVKWLEVASGKGNAYAQYTLGKLYLSGEDVLQDVECAVHYFEMSAAQGNEYAAYQLGKLYLSGEHLTKNVAEGIRWMEAAAEKGNPCAQYSLGKLYLCGKDVPRDREKAVVYLEASAAQGNIYAQFFLDHLDSFRDLSAFLAATRLLHRLEELFREDYRKGTGQTPYHIDRKRRRKLAEKKQAQGHKRDDHEPVQQQSL